VPSPTPDWYSTHADAFCPRTFVVETEGTRARFPRHEPAGSPILDVGCGSGRDSKRFAELGYAVDVRDRSREIADEAARRTGLAVRVEDVLELDDRDAFDGIWACAMLIHLDDAKFDEAVRRLARALRPGGAIYISLKESERVDVADGRTFRFRSPEEVSRSIRAIEMLRLVEEWSWQDGPPKETRWINAIARRLAD
jgi:2-polyprenyl-3-methyl-5-hydroxy-6-metoxy-1,4-benzoquinol methylase